MRPRRRWIANLVLGTVLSATGGGGSSTAGTVQAQASAASTIEVAANPPSAVLRPPGAFDPQAALEAHRAALGAPGAIALLRRGGGEWVGVSGSADVAGTELTAATRFRIASITKPIVAALLLDAVARDELSLDDIVGDLVPGAVRMEPPVTVRMLLDHTSGIFNVADEGDMVADIARLTDPALQQQAADLAARYLAGESVVIPDTLFVALAETHDRYFAPGQGYHYSNVNYQLAAMVLTRTTGMSLGQHLRTRLVEPLGLRHTTIAPEDPGLPDLHGYVVDAGGALADRTGDFLALGNGGSGGVISNAGEVLTILQAIVSGRLLPPALVSDMATATTHSGGSYGLGLATYDLVCGTFLGHGGAVSGTESIALVSPDGGTGVVIVVNVRPTAGPHLLALAEAMLCAEP